MATKNPFEHAALLADEWSKLVIPLTRDLDARDSDWDKKMPRKVYAAISQLWVERRAFLDRLRVELKGKR